MIIVYAFIALMAGGEKHFYEYPSLMKCQIAEANMLLSNTDKSVVGILTTCGKYTVHKNEHKKSPIPSGGY